MYQFMPYMGAGASRLTPFMQWLMRSGQAPAGPMSAANTTPSAALRIPQMAGGGVPAVAGGGGVPAALPGAGAPGMAGMSVGIPGMTAGQMASGAGMAGMAGLLGNAAMQPSPVAPPNPGVADQLRMINQLDAGQQPAPQADSNPANLGGVGMTSPNEGSPSFLGGSQGLRPPMLNWGSPRPRPDAATANAQLNEKRPAVPLPPARPKDLTPPSKGGMEEFLKKFFLAGNGAGRDPAGSSN